jgi:hypothetical protein
LLRISQMAQQKAAKPTICKFGFLGINFSHQNQNCSVFVGLQSALITHAVRLQAYLAREQSKKLMDYVFIFITELTIFARTTNYHSRVSHLKVSTNNLFSWWLTLICLERKVLTCELVMVYQSCHNFFLKFLSKSSFATELTLHKTMFMRHGMS